MSRWYLITHNPKAAQLLVHRIRALGAEVFSPTKLKVTKRADCNGVRTSETQLFPGYLFVRLDPEMVHTSAVLQLSGVNEFVSFGGVLATISDSLIEAIKGSLLVRTDKKIAKIEHRNVSPELLARLEAITLIKSVPDRQVALFEILQKEKSLLNRLPASSQIYSAIEQPFVNDLIS
ncbi:transcription termination/antitermination NusG family protein [Pseudomonas sp. Marseille-Q5115]|uniref:transcription termination/antitermination NusG family protein n=1 Tax=unclassified Pseudomonas TaxID=196821 RepID=UPI001CE409F6|nr:transcription termination/antitermination NusG family protein [Pseudomonas sp. Marseille-Q5115]